MLILPIEQAKEGMRLAAPVTHPDHPDQDLLKAGYTLENKVLKRLHDLNIGYVYVAYPGLDELDRHLAANLSPARQKLYTQIKTTIIAGQKHTRPAVSYTDYYATTRELVLTLMSQGQHPVYIEHMSRLGDDAITHATAVAHLSLLLGIKLELYLISQRRRLPTHHAKEVVNLGVAGMLHDMGKLTLGGQASKCTITQPPESADDAKLYEEHSQRGYELIRGGVEPSAAVAVLHHHQRWDGSGFPATQHRDGTTYHLKQNDIHIFARILCVADLYDRLVTRLGSTERRSNLEVLHEMRTQYASWCDPAVLKALQGIAPPFPPGSILSLSDQTRAIVVDVDHADPYRPIVKRMVGTADQWELDPTRTDLRKPGAPRITHIGGVAVEPYLPAGSEPTSRTAGTTPALC